MKFSFTSAFAVIAAALALSGSPLHAQTTPFYNATTLPANPQTGAVHFMQQVTFANSPANYTLNSFVLGVNYADISQNAGVIVQFYTGLDLSNTSSNVLANATYLYGVSGTLAAPTAAGNYSYTFTLNTPFTFPAGTSTVGVEFLFTDDQLANYSTATNGRFSAVAPTVGSSQNYVWNDADLDNNFTGAEKTNFGQTGAYVRFSLTGSVAAVPEPGTYALFGAAALAFGGLYLRRRTIRA